MGRKEAAGEFRVVKLEGSGVRRHEPGSSEFGNLARLELCWS